MKVTLCAPAQADGVLPLALVREALAAALGKAAAYDALRTSYARPVQGVSRSGLLLRMTRAQAAAVIEAAHRAGVSLGDYVAELVAGVAVATGGTHPAEHLAALMASSVPAKATSLREPFTETRTRRFDEVRALIGGCELTG